MRSLRWTGSDRSMLKARQWIAECIHNHGCSNIVPALQRSEETAFWPTRLIAVRPSSLGSPNYIRVISPSQPCEYTTLSCCWGTHVETPWCSTIRNIDFELSLHQLPKTLQDAVQITRKLGYNYLWVDALCILQDSLVDWEQESAKMGLVFSNSCVTIAATSSSSSTSGIFNTTSHSQAEYDPRIIEIRPETNDNTSGLSVFEWHDGNERDEQRSPYQVREGPLSERAWSYLERLFSPRTLHYASDQLLWECRECYLTEDGLHTQPFSLPSAIHYTASRGLRSLVQIPASKKEFEILYGWYGKVLPEYTRRRLTRPTDKLPAISAAAKVIHEATGAVYHAGLWLSVIQYGLGWIPKAYLTRPAEYRCPSYSWAAYDGAVEWRVGIFDFAEPPPADFTVVGHGIESQSSDPFGSVDGGYLELYGQMKSARLVTMVDGAASGVPKRNTHCVEYEELWTEQGGVPSLIVWYDERLTDDFDFNVECFLLCSTQEELPDPIWSTYVLLLHSTGNEREFKRVGIAEIRTDDRVKWFNDSSRRRIRLV